jgi:hypothetical protein
MSGAPMPGQVVSWWRWAGGSSHGFATSLRMSKPVVPEGRLSLCGMVRHHGGAVSSSRHQPLGACGLCRRLAEREDAGGSA